MEAVSRILLIISGGVAAYKALELARLCAKKGIEVTGVLTENAQQFITPLSLQALTGNKVYTDLFSLTDDSEMGHIQLSRAADLLVVAPATAHILARMAGGIADDLATTLLLATDKPVLAVPAMNVRMWNHPATQANLAALKSRGVLFTGPDDGEMACGEYGPGRLAEPPAILAAIESALSDGPLKGKHAIVTSGPTYEPIDPVRYIANRSSGKQGHAIAAALAALGARVTLIAGPVAIADPPRVETTHVETALEMRAAIEAALPADIAVCCAAVADWRVDAAEDKIKKSSLGAPALKLIENPDLLAELSRHPQRPKLVIGFAAETSSLLDNAIAKRVRKGCDWLLANDVGPGTGVMGGETNTLHLITATGIQHWPSQSKQAAAQQIAQLIAESFN